MDAKRIVRAGLSWALVGFIAAVMVGSGSTAQAAPETTSGQKTEQKAEPKKVVRYVGSSQSKKYHKLACEWAKKISKDNRVEFASVSEARKAGYEPCRVCFPPKPSAVAAPAAPAATGTKPAKTGQ